MLEKREYTKEELTNIFGTDKTCNITRKIESLGYKYETNKKKGKNYRLIITATPENSFKEMCIKELGITAQTDFRVFGEFFYLFFGDEEFQQLPYVDMEKEMKKCGISITRQTIAKWVDRFKQKDLINESNEYIYYSSSKTLGTIEITKEEYLNAWKTYWFYRYQGYEYNFCYCEMCNKIGGAPIKKAKIEENGFYTMLINKLFEELEK